MVNNAFTTPENNLLNSITVADEDIFTVYCRFCVTFYIIVGKNMTFGKKKRRKNANLLCCDNLHFYTDKHA